MSQAGKIHAAWRSYQRIDAELISRPALSSKKFPPNVNRRSTISKDTDEPTNEAKSLPVKYSKLESVRCLRCVGSEKELCELKCGVTINTSAPFLLTRCTSAIAFMASSKCSMMCDMKTRENRSLSNGHGYRSRSQTMSAAEFGERSMPTAPASCLRV